MQPYVDHEHTDELSEQALLTNDSHHATPTHTQVSDILIIHISFIHDLCLLFNLQSVPFQPSQHPALRQSVAHVMMLPHPPDIKGHLVRSSNIVGVLMLPQMMLR
jgi:hypothetical protein